MENIQFHVVLERKLEYDEEMYSIIISSWVIETHQNNICTAYWPPEKDVQKCLKYLRSPKKSWKIFDAEIIATYDTYERAKKKEAQLVKNKSASESDDFANRKRQPKKKIDFDFNNESITPPPSFSLLSPSSPNNESFFACVANKGKPTIEKHKQTTKITNQFDKNATTDLNFQTEIYDINKLPIIETPIQIIDGQITDGTILHINIQTPADCFDQIIRKLDTIYKRVVKLEVAVEDLTVSMNRIEQMNGHFERTKSHIPSNFNMFELPLKDINGILQLEDLINKDELKKVELFNYFKTIGGKNERNAVQKCMFNLLTTQLSNEVSWCGRKGNHKIGHMQIFKIMLAGIRTHFPNILEKIYEQTIMDFLKLSKQRLERESKN